MLAHKDGSKPDIPKGIRERAERNNIGMAVVCPVRTRYAPEGSRRQLALLGTTLKGWRVAGIVEQLGSGTCRNPSHFVWLPAREFFIGIVEIVAARVRI